MKTYLSGNLLPASRSDSAKNSPSNKINNITNNTSKEIISIDDINEPYHLDFYTNDFWFIRIKYLAKNYSAQYIQDFFKIFEQVEDVIITVKDINNPIIDKYSCIVLEPSRKYTKKINAHLFRAILSKDTKNPYVKKYDNPYERLKEIIFDANKEIILEEY